MRDERGLGVPMMFDVVPTLSYAALDSHMQPLLCDESRSADSPRRVLICGSGFEPVSASSNDAQAIQVRAVSLDGLRDAEPADVLLLGEQTALPSRSQVESALAAVSPGGLLAWLIPQPRSAAHMQRLLHLQGGESHPLAAEQISRLLDADGFDVDLDRSRFLTSEPSPALKEIAATVASHDGDGAALLRDASISHLLLVAHCPRRRASAHDASDARRAIHDAVSAAAASGVDLGNESTSIVETQTQSDLRVSLVIPVFNGAQLTEKCLYGIAGNTAHDPNYEVLVVDNGSTDWTMYLLHAMEGDLRVFSNDRNLGFARACNQGAAESQADYVLFLNNDTVPHPEWLSAMVATADSDERVGIVGARCLYPDGTVQHAGIELVDGIPEHVFRGATADDPRVTISRDLDMVTGACMMIRRDLFEELGGFDPQFVNGVEDVDLCLRARERGYRVVYCGEAVIDHHEAQTEGRYDHVQENLSLFVERWNGRFDGVGRLQVQEDLVTHPVSMMPAEARILAVPNGGSDSSVDLVQTASVSETPAAPLAPSDQPQRRRVNWEGSFFLYSSLAFVNRELVMAMLNHGDTDMGLIPFEVDQFGVEEDPRFQVLAARMGQGLEDADVHIRHRWPPDLERPATGRHVLMQPWEFGRVPVSWVEALADGRVDQVWAYTNYVRNCYISSGVDPKRVAVVPPGVDPDRFCPGLTAHEVVDTKATFRFLFVGGTLRRKGIDVLLQAFGEEFGSDEDVALVIKDMGVNTFYDQQTAGEAIEKLQADAQCAEIQYLTQDLPGDQIPRLYAASDALVHPYRGEGFGLTVAEAMACGLPVILTRGGACDDFCPDEIGYFIDSTREPVIFGGEETAGQAWELEPDLASLRQQMRQVFTERGEAHRRGVRGMAHIHSHFTWADSAYKAQEALKALDQLPLTPNASPKAIKAAAIILGQAPTHETDAALELIVGPHSRYSVSLEGEHVLGEQLDAILSNVDEDVSLLFILAHDVEMDPADVRSLIAHFETADRLGMLIPDRVSGVMGSDMAEVSMTAIVDSPCVVLRASALAEVGGFDAGFASIAVLANLARGLRRRNWNIQAAEEVVVKDPADEVTVPLTSGWASIDLCVREVTAVTALEEGDRRRSGGDTEGAIECYERSLAAKENFVEVLLLLADACLDAGRPTDAAAVAARLTNLDPTSAWAQNFSALVHARAGDIEAARAGFAAAVELNPDLAEARVNLAVMAWEAGEMDTALEHFRHASDLDPFNHDLICNLGLIYTQTGDTREAVDLYLAYLAQVPEDVEVLGRLAEVQLQRQENADARATATRLLQVDPENARARLILQQRAESG